MDLKRKQAVTVEIRVLHRRPTIYLPGTLNNVLMSQVTVEIMSADRASSFAKSMTSVYNFWKGFVVLIFRVIYSFKYTHLKMVNAGLW